MAAELGWGTVILLAIVQGITEFLPISSSAHLLLPSQLLGLPDQGLMFDTAVHGGTLIGVISYFREDLGKMARACFTRDFALAEERSLAIWLIVASLPVLIVGFLGADFIATWLRNLWVIGWTTLIFALLLWWAVRSGGTQTKLRARMIFWVGLAQVLALMPGVSRAGITLTAGLWQGLSATTATRLAFLLSIPVLGAACGYGIYQLIILPAPQLLIKALTAAALAALCTYLTIAFFLRIIQRMGLMPFVIYRIVLGTVLLSYLFILGPP